MGKLDELKKDYKKLYGRQPHWKWDAKRIEEEIAKKSKGSVKEVKAPPIDPIPQAEQADTPMNTPTDPMLLKLLAGQQDILGKVVNTLDEIKDGLKEIKPKSPEEANAEFNESLKNTHFEAQYTYEIYALKYKSNDGSEEWGLTGKLFSNETEANKYGLKEFGIGKYKLMRTKKPVLVENKKEKEKE